jgi:hypothetical protein
LDHRRSAAGGETGSRCQDASVKHRFSRFINPIPELTTMRVPLLLSAFLLPLIFAACADLPSAPNATPGDMLADCRWNPDGSVACDPVQSAPDEPPPCDPYLTIGGCDDNCEMSAPGMDDPEHVGIAGCNQTGTNPAPGDGNWGGGGTPGTGEEEPETAYEEGPLAWAACVLAVLGATYSVDQVAGVFGDWWEAQRAYDSAKRMLDAIYANPQGVSPETTALWEFQVQYHRDRVVAARSAVVSATNTSYWALGTAAVGCGAAAFLPTP